MTGRDLLKSTNLLKTTFNRTSSTGSSRSQSTQDKGDDFSKVLFAKRDEKRSTEKPKFDSKGKKDISKKETPEPNKANENQRVEDKDKKVESKDNKSEDKTKKVEDKDKKIENKDQNIEDTNQSTDNIDQSTEETLSELNALIEDLIHTLQSSNIIDKDKLQQIVSDFEKTNLNIDEMKSLVKELELVGKDIAKLETLDIDEKFAEISKLIKELDMKSTNENTEQILENSKQIDVDKSYSAEELQSQGNLNAEESQNQKNLNTEELQSQNKPNSEELQNKESLGVDGEKTVNSKISEKKEKAEVNVSLQDNNKDKQTFGTKKNISNTTPKENDFDFLNIKDIQIDDYKSNEVTGLSKALENTAKPDMKIFNQIIEGTKLNISEDVSEMVIKMKPDNLGKLSMKIVVERGMLVAKFEVESQVVKEAVESNLEDLRNALKDKGFEVQQLDVSVNKDSDHRENNFSYLNRGKTKKISMKNANISTESYGGTRHQTIDDLTSTINYLG